MAPVCRFWQQGNCRFGDRCKFQHYEEQSRPSSGNSFGGNQRAEPLSSRNNNTYQSGNSSYQSGSNTRQSGTSAPQTLPFILNKDAILTDLTTEKPQWILSAYGPGSRAPAQLFGGPMREQSFEEMRLRHYIAMANGNPQQAILEAQQLYQEAEQQIKNAVNNIGGAIDYILNAAKEHPNRVDIVNESSKSSVGPLQPNPFNNPKPFLTPIANPFGAPSSQPAAPAFGAPSAPTGAFGQPSNLGQSQNPFGSPTPPFGAPSQPPGAIGRPSLLGQKPNPFGAPSGSSASPFSTPAPTATPFGQPSQPPAGNAFGAPSSQPNPFGAAPGGGPFGQPPPAPGRPSGGQPANPSPFGASSAPPPTSFGGNSFSPSPAAHANPFGQGQAAQVNPSPFGQAPNQPALNANPFGQKPSSFGAPSMSAMNGSGSSDEMSQHAPLNSYCTKDSEGRLTMWKGRRVEYKIIDEVNVPGYTKDGKWIKIWFPNGPHMDKDISMSEGTEYDQETIDAYAYASKHGRFKGGLLPKLPPKPEWIKYDF